MTSVPFSLPGNVAGIGLLPVTVIVKLLGCAVPPSSLITILVTLRVAVVNMSGAVPQLALISLKGASVSLITPEPSAFIV